MITAIQTIAKDFAAGDISLDDIKDAVSKRLYTADMPDPDLVIRTSGEERISDFLLWQMAYLNCISRRLLAVVRKERPAESHTDLSGTRATLR